MGLIIRLNGSQTTSQWVSDYVSMGLRLRLNGSQTTSQWVSDYVSMGLRLRLIRVILIWGGGWLRERRGRGWERDYPRPRAPAPLPRAGASSYITYVSVRAATSSSFENFASPRHCRTMSASQPTISEIKVSARSNAIYQARKSVFFRFQTMLVTLRVAELQELLVQANMTRCGRKQQLIDRLSNYLKEYLLISSCGAYEIDRYK